MTPEPEKKPRGSKYATAPIFEITALVDERLTGAACRGMAPLFDAHLDDETDAQREYRYHQARTVCLRCPVRPACETAASEHDAVGLWSGRMQGGVDKRRAPMTTESGFENELH